VKVGDLVDCPVDLDTGEMFSGNWELAIIFTLYENEPKIGVVYLSKLDFKYTTGTWFTEEIRIVNTG